MRRSISTLLLFLVASSASQAEPPPLGDSATERAARTLAEEIEGGKHPGIHGFLMAIDGRVIAEAGRKKLEREPPDLRSVTKSVTALLVGIAIDRGEIANVDVPVMDLLDDERVVLQGDARKRRMTVADLLTMRSGLDCDDWNADSPGHEDRMYRRRDWLAFWAKQQMRDDPGSRYSYCTGNAIALGHIVARASGVPLDVYAQTHLFAPLGIVDARWERWNRGREIDAGGHLRLSPDALLRIGELVRGRGEVDGKRIVSTQWVDRMTTEHVAQIPNHGQRYGYLWWLDVTKRPDLPRTRVQMAWGNGGNFLIVLPERHAVVVFAGTRYNAPDALEPLLWVRDRLLGAAPAN